MAYIFLLNGLILLVILFVLLFGFFRHYKREEIGKIVHIFSLLFFVYVYLAIFSFYWFFGFSQYSSNDFGYIYMVAILVQTFVLYGTFSLLIGNKKILKWLFFYVSILFSFYISVQYLPLIILTISFLLSLVLFLNLYSSSFVYKELSYVGIFYSAISVLFQFLIFFKIGDLTIYSLISAIVFFIFTYMFLRDLTKYPVNIQKYVKLERESPIVLFFKYFIFMIVLINLVLVSTISLHEFSHVAVSRYYGCESRTIAYEGGGYPYSEIVCRDLKNKIPITLAGPLGPIIVAAFLFFVGGRYIRPISILVIGFNLLAGYRDFKDIGLSDNLILGISVFSIILLFFGVVFLARSRMEDYQEFKLKD